MTNSSTADSSCKPRPLNEPQTVQNSDREPSASDNGDGDDDAQSVDSSKTVKMTGERELAKAEEYRKTKISLGGKPTRPIQEYSKEREQQRPIIRYHVPTDEEWFCSHGLNESDYFYYELTAWQAFFENIMYSWQAENKRAGGTLPPPSPIYDAEPVELHTRYLVYLLHRRKEAFKDKYRAWYFPSYENFVEHIAAVRKQLADLCEERGREPEETPFMQEQLKIVEEQLANYRQQAQQPMQQSLPDHFFRRGNKAQVAYNAANSGLVETQPTSSKQKRARDQDTAEPEPGPSSKSAKKHEREHSSSSPAPKRRRQGARSGRLKSTSGAKPSPKPTRGKGHHKELEEAQLAPKTAQKRRGRPRKQAEQQPGPAADAPTPGKPGKAAAKRRGGPPKAANAVPAPPSTAQGEATQSGQKRRGRLRGKAQPPSAAAAAKTTEREETAGLRRSARIAARKRTIFL